MSNKLSQIIKNHLKECLKQSPDDASLYGFYQTLMQTVEIAAIEVVMAHTDGNQTTASQLLGWHRNTLRNKIQQYQMNKHQHDYREQ